MSIIAADRPVTVDLAEGRMVGRTIGNALVIHPASGVDPQVRDLAIAVAPDEDYQLVVFDLPAGSSIARWESAIELVPRDRRGARIVVHGRSEETALLAGEWLTRRLGRPVVVPDGAVVPAAGGSLFVDSGQGGGWMRLRRRQRTVRESRRFPRPPWESSVLLDPMVTGLRGVAEPLPSGAWIHEQSEASQLDVHRERLIRVIPGQPDVVVVILGTPGDTPLSLEDIARFWEAVPAETRPRLRPVAYGPLDVADDVDWPQQLADLVGTAIVCYTGVPVGSASGIEVRTVLDDGVLGWRATARELRFFPQVEGRGAQSPRVVSYDTPVEGVHQVAPAVFWYAPDAVVEVVPCGLWMRSADAPAHAAAVRSLAVDRTRQLVLFEDVAHGDPARMHRLAADVIAQLDAATQRLSELQPVSAVLEGLVPEPASTSVPVERFPLAPALPAHEAAAFDVPMRETRLDVAPAADEVATDRGIDTPAVPRPVERPYPADVRAVAVPSMPSVTHRDAPPLTTPGSVPDPDVPVGVQAVQDAMARPEPDADHRDGHLLRAPARGDIDASTVRSAGAVRRSSGSGYRWQTQPAPQAAALPDGGDLQREREWLRRAMREQFAEAATVVSRVLSENPAFTGALTRSADDVLTDAVAARLHLMSELDEVSGPLRRGEVGPHVPLARCIVSGLNRLPSHRGVTAIRLGFSGAPWEAFAERARLTEWGFLEGTLGKAQTDVDSEVDLLVWSLTARRSRLLEPRTGSGSERVVFLPGTSFVVLDRQAPGEGRRGRVLLRELAPGEEHGGTDSDVRRTGLDELALTALVASLDQSVERGPQPLARAAASPPGMVALADGAGTR